MRGVLVKLDPGRDRYIVWSQITDMPVFAGSREEILAAYGDIEGECPTCHHWMGPEESTRETIARADRNGSSGRTRTWWWDGTGDCYAQLGWLERDRLEQVVELLYDRGVVVDDDAILELLGPLE